MTSRLTTSEGIMAHFTETVEDILSMALEHSELPSMGQGTTQQFPQNLPMGYTDQFLSVIPTANQSNEEFPMLFNGSSDWTDLISSTETGYLNDLSHSLDYISPTLPMQLPRSTPIPQTIFQPSVTCTSTVTSTIDDIDIEDVLSQFQDDIGSQHNQMYIPTQHNQSFVPNQQHNQSFMPSQNQRNALHTHVQNQHRRSLTPSMVDDTFR